MNWIYSLKGVSDPIDATVVAFVILVALVTWSYCIIASIRWWINTKEV